MNYKYMNLHGFISPIAQTVTGLRRPSPREQELYEGIDREIIRIKLGREINVIREG
jgi:hypothetical protein